MNLKAQVIGLNNFLTEVYGTETRLSLLLADLGFSQQQVEVIHNNHTKHVVASAIGLLKEQLTTRSVPDRLYQIVCRRFGLDGNPPETLQSIGQLMGLSRERVRQLQQKALKRCKARVNRQRWEEGLRVIASDLIGEPQGGVIPLPLNKYPCVESTNQRGTRAFQAKPLETSEYSKMANMAVRILQAVPEGLSVGMLAHILYGSSGPVIDSLVTRHNFPQYGAYRSLGHSKVRRMVMDLCKLGLDFVVVEGKVRLKTEP